MTRSISDKNKLDDAIILNYEVYGEGLPILLIHGFGCDLSLMKEAAEPIFSKKTQYKRYYIDLPGMGHSSSDVKFASADKILAAVLQFIDTTISEPFLLVGQSFGGYISSGILSKLKDKVLSAFLLCPVVLPAHSERTLPQKNEAYYDHEFLSILPADKREDFTSFGVICNEKTFELFEKAIAPGIKNADATFLEILSLNYALSFNPLLPTYNQPITILCGKQDDCVGYQDQFHIIPNYPKSNFYVLDKAGHNLQIDQPEQFNYCFENWLKNR